MQRRWVGHGQVYPWRLPPLRARLLPARGGACMQLHWTQPNRPFTRSLARPPRARDTPAALIGRAPSCRDAPLFNQFWGSGWRRGYTWHARCGRSGRGRAAVRAAWCSRARRRARAQTGVGGQALTGAVAEAGSTPPSAILQKQQETCVHASACMQVATTRCQRRFEPLVRSPLPPPPPQVERRLQCSNCCIHSPPQQRQLRSVQPVVAALDGRRGSKQGRVARF